jgi:hypothetical protein
LVAQLTTLNATTEATNEVTDHDDTCCYYDPYRDLFARALTCCTHII